MGININVDAYTGPEYQAAAIMAELTLEKGYAYRTSFSIAGGSLSSRDPFALPWDEILVSQTSDRAILLLARQEETYYYVKNWNGGAPMVASLSKKHMLAEDLKEMAEYFTQVETPEGTYVPIRFWRRTNTGAEDFSRNLATPEWGASRENFNEEVRNDLEGLVFAKPEDHAGRIVLLYGPPGTGKTSLLRSLSHQWQQWASVEYVADPESFFGDAAYMTQVVMSAQPSKKKWRVLVMEDVGEMIEASHGHSHSGMSRLLNMADGMMGQGQNLIFILTTNHTIQKIHPAVVRPGRCMFRSEIGPFSAGEASNWLGTTVREPMTLAEMYYEKSQQKILTQEDEQVSLYGAYL